MIEFFNFSFFILLAIILIYIPGYLLIKQSKWNFEDQEILALSFGLGLVTFVFIALSLGFLHLRFLTWIIYLAVNLWTIFKFRQSIFKPWRLFKDKLLIFLVVSGILIQGFINFPSGYHYQDGLNFWSAQGHDGLWHVAVMEEIVKEIPPKNPIFSGEPLYNYHYLVDILMGDFTRITYLNSLDLYFRFFPVLFSFMISLSVFAFVSHWQKKAIGYLGIFFTIFTGSFGYFVTFARDRNIFGGETVFWMAQGNTVLGNPPHAVGFSLIPAFLLLLLIYLKSREKYLFALLLLLGAVLAGYKVSAGFVLLSGLGILSLFEIFKKKFSVPLLTTLLGFTNLLTVKLMTHDIGNFLIWQPWWFVRTMVVAGDRLNWIDLENKRQYYLSLHSIRGYLRDVEYETLAFLIFLVGNIGTRLMAFFEIFRKRIVGEFEIVMLFIMVSGFLVPMLFVQRGITYNIIEFMQYFLLILGFYAAIVSYKLIIKPKKIIFRIIVFLIIGLLSVPTVIGNLNEFYGPGRTPLSQVSNQELSALNYLKSNSSKDSLVMVMPFNKYFQDQYKYQPRPIYVWYSTAYVSALSSRRTYLSSEEQASITGYPVDNRLTLENRFFSDTDLSWNRQFLKQNGIDYLYLTKPEFQNYAKDHHLSNEQISNFAKDNGLEKFFENSEVIIYHVKYG